MTRVSNHKKFRILKFFLGLSSAGLVSCAGLLGWLGWLAEMAGLARLSGLAGLAGWMGLMEALYNRHYSLQVKFLTFEVAVLNYTN